MADIMECAAIAEGTCPRTWENCAATGDRMIRFCTECFKAVYWCETEAEARARIEAGHRAALAQPGAQPVVAK
jgi:hypothetical protein